MTESYLLGNEAGRRIYAAVAGLPIIDYHCHLSPQEIWEDLPFDNIGEMWLKYDHYKWRLMRTAGIDERLITGDASWQEKFTALAGAIEMAAGHPLYHWCHMELAMFFGIHTPLRRDTADEIWEAANRRIREEALSPRKLILRSHVEALCTTDDIVDSLEWHDRLREDRSFPVRVLPSYRTDNLMLMCRPGYGDYIRRLSRAAGVAVTDLASLKAAAADRLDYFVARGCRVTDVGIPFFPDVIYDEAQADGVFRRVLAGEPISGEEYTGLLGNLYVFFGGLYRERGLLMQWHLSVVRNTNTVLFDALGADCGVDAVGDPVPVSRLVTVLDAINRAGGLPRTVIYTLNAANAAQIASVTGAFPGVCCGAAWWFCDHKRGIEEELDVVAENACLGEFLGMLTDSRSFLSYARHDYFRRILANKIGAWVEAGEYDPASAPRLAAKICYENIKKAIGE